MKKKPNMVQIRTNIKQFTYVNISCTLRWTSLIGNPFNSLQANQNLHKTILFLIQYSILTSVIVAKNCYDKFLHLRQYATEYEKYLKICTIFFNQDVNYFESFTMYFILLIALIQKTVITYLRFSPLNSLSKNLLNWSFPAGSWSNSSILNAHRFTLRCGISRGFLNS